MTVLQEVKNELLSLADSDTAIHSQRFFKTGKGEYGEGDVFLGIRVPVLRQLAKKHRQLALKNIQSLLRSQYHEQRLLAVIMLVNRYKKSDDSSAALIFSSYINNTKYINNWDLVDVSAPNIIGAHLYKKNRKLLYALCRSDNLWERRIAIISTLYFIRNSDYNDCLKITELLMHDPQDLIHKACGWMLRETGKKSEPTLIAFLDKYAAIMPRTMLRYALEKLPEKLRHTYMMMKSR